MSVDASVAAHIDAAEARLAGAAAPVREPWIRVRLGAADRPLVEVGQRIAAGAPIAERLRDARVDEARLGKSAAPAPGSNVEAGVALVGEGRGALRFEGAGRVLYSTPGGLLRVAVGRHAEPLLTPASGVVESVGAAAIIVRADGIGLRGTLTAGDATVGRLMIAVRRPDEELPVAAVDVGSAGAILVAGARIDVEALTRARAMGIRGVIVGGVVGRDLRSFAASEARQRAALHASPPFALLVLDGYGKRPIPPAAWRALLAAEGRDVGISADPSWVLLDGATPVTPQPAGRVRIVAGDGLGRVGRMVGAVGRRRLPAGVMALVVRVALEAGGPGQPPEERLVPLADLERTGP